MQSNVSGAGGEGALTVSSQLFVAGVVSRKFLRPVWVDCACLALVWWCVWWWTSPAGGGGDLQVVREQIFEEATRPLFIALE